MKSKYSNLLRASGSPSEVAEILYPSAGLGPVGKAGEIFKLCKAEIHKLVYHSLDFKSFKNERGEFLKVLPDNLGLELKERVEQEYQSFLDTLDMQQMIKVAESEVLHRIEVYAWNCGLIALPGAIQEMAANLSANSDEYDRMIGSTDESSLSASYEAAMKTTLAERISGTNSDDILIYRQELIEYLEKTCSVRMYEVFRRFFSILSCSNVFTDIKYKIMVIIDYLIEMGVCADDSEGVLAENDVVPGVVFTDFNEKSPEKALLKYFELSNNNKNI